MVLLIRSTHRFQSTLPVRGATRQLARRPDLGGNFNPRSPCGERQMFSPAPCGASGYFNPRSPCGERRLYAESRLAEYKFQSTLPVRGATRRRCKAAEKQLFQSTLPVRGATYPKRARDWNIKFQSTLPVRGATHLRGRPHAGTGISIHAPRAGSDKDWIKCLLLISEISIHAPRAGSDFDGQEMTLCCNIFQSTLPVRGATKKRLST